MLENILSEIIVYIQIDYYTFLQQLLAAMGACVSG